jgi:hypothetical protein
VPALAWQGGQQASSGSPAWACPSCRRGQSWRHRWQACTGVPGGCRAPGRAATQRAPLRVQPWWGCPAAAAAPRLQRPPSLPARRLPRQPPIGLLPAAPACVGHPPLQQQRQQQQGRQPQPHRGESQHHCRVSGIECLGWQGRLLDAAAERSRRTTPGTHRRGGLAAAAAPRVTGQ